MTGGGAKLVVEQLLRSTKQMIAPAKFVTEIDLIESARPCGALPRDPVLQFEALPRGRICLVQKREVADATESENCR